MAKEKEESRLVEVVEVLTHLMLQERGQAGKKGGVRVRWWGRVVEFQEVPFHH